MKKNVLSILFCLIFLSAFAGKNDKWLDCGLRGSFNNTWLINPNVFKDKTMKYDISFGFTAGAKLGFNFSEVVALTAEYDYSTFNQKYMSSTATQWNRQVKLAYAEIPLLLRITSGFSYFEVGPKMSLLQSATDTYSAATPSVFTPDYSGVDISKNLNSSSFGVVLGWGSILWGTGGLTISTGLRLSYMFTDIVNENGGKGKDYTYMEGSGATTTPVNLPYAATSPASVGVMINFDYDLGYIVTSSCKRSRKFVFFNH